MTTIEYMKTLTEQEIKAAKMALDTFGMEPTIENITKEIDHDYLSFSDKNEKRYCWYLDCDNHETCIEVNTLTRVDAREAGLY